MRQRVGGRWPSTWVPELERVGGGNRDGRGRGRWVGVTEERRMAARPAGAPTRTPGLVNRRVPSAWRPSDERAGAVWRRERSQSARGRWPSATDAEEPEERQLLRRGRWGSQETGAFASGGVVPPGCRPSRRTANGATSGDLGKGLENGRAEALQRFFQASAEPTGRSAHPASSGQLRITITAKRNCQNCSTSSMRRTVPAPLSTRL